MNNFGCANMLGQVFFSGPQVCQVSFTHIISDWEGNECHRAVAIVFILRTRISGVNQLQELKVKFFYLPILRKRRNHWGLSRICFQILDLSLRLETFYFAFFVWPCSVPNRAIICTIETGYHKIK